MSGMLMGYQLGGGEYADAWLQNIAASDTSSDSMASILDFILFSCGSPYGCLVMT
jgi:hypothetical protein